MKILRCFFDGYKNLKEVELKPHSKINLIFGNNAQGKTNFLEAIYFFSGNLKFSRVQSFINFDSDFANLAVDFEICGLNQNVKANLADKNSFFLNDVEVSRQTDFCGNFPVIYFNPSVFGEIFVNPKKRRKFIDDAIFQIKPLYLKFCRQYCKALNQRNVILKSKCSNYCKSLKSWNFQLAKFGTIITAYRQSYLKKLSKLIEKTYCNLDRDGEKLEIEYCSTVFDGDFNVQYDEKNVLKYLEKLENCESLDYSLGFTSIGAHRDDLKFKINGLNLQNYGSRGQKKFFLIAIKLGQAKLLEIFSGTNPVILLDDVLSELDLKRQRFIFSNIKDNQIFITCCDFSYVSNLKFGEIIFLEGGEIKKTNIK